MFPIPLAVIVTKSMVPAIGFIMKPAIPRETPLVKPLIPPSLAP